MSRHLAALAASQGITVRGSSTRRRSGRTVIVYTLTGGSVVARRTLADAMLSQDTRRSRATHRPRLSALVYLIGA